jgi:hypothetical protein
MKCSVNSVEILMTPEETETLRARMTSSSVDRIPGIRILAHALSAEPPFIPTSPDYMHPLQNLIGHLLREETDFIGSLWNTGRGQEAADRMASPFGISALHSAMKQMSDAGVPFENFELNPPRQTIEAWSDI